MDSLTFFLYVATSLFTIVNPFGAMPVFLSMTEGMEREKVAELSRQASVTAGLVMLGFALAGEAVFSFFNISVDGLRVVGGVLFAVMGYDMIHGHAARAKNLSREEREEVDGAAITPLAVPLIAGPGAITVTTVLMKENPDWLKRSLIVAAVVLVSLATYLFLIYSSRILKMIGQSGNRVFSRLMGLIMMMIAVEFFFRGLKPFVQSLMQP